MKIVLENVRSFCGRHSIPIRPLTLLVGENSTGKSTFLAMLSHVSSFAFPSFRPSFNEDPFALGTYDSIATYKGGRFGRAHSFSVGTIGYGKRLIATYGSYKGQPELENLEARIGDERVELAVDPKTQIAKLKVHTPDLGAQIVTFSLKGKTELQAKYPIPYFLRNLLYETRATRKSRKLNRVLERLLYETVHYVRENARPAVALAPVRTRPKRTYDVISDEFTPEGDHIPVLLARIFQGEESAGRQRLLQALSEFGSQSGLFERISVKSLGKRPSDPFQILVWLGGPAANLLDVGYGVSQALPIVVQSVLGQRTSSIQLLLQQPEVHLHPRGQAALGSFFSRLVAKQRMGLVVETHSDYLLDRVRQEVARGTIHRNKVLILFFEKDELETTVHEIELDKNGNVLRAPKSYREFFLEEERNLLTRAGK